MATFQEPIITKIFWGGFDLQNLMWALYKHFDTSPTSQFTPSLSNEITTNSLGAGTYSFLLTPNAAGETWQLNFRNSGTQGSPSAVAVNLGIDPAATIVDSSASPPSSDSDFSGEILALQITTGASTDGTAFVLEYPDALCVLLPSGALSPQSIPHGFVAGKVWTAAFANDPTLGRDGLAILGHIPRISISDADAYWLTTNASGISLFHLGTDSWDNTVGAALAADLAQLDWMDEGGATSPGPVVITHDSRPLGVMKHVFYMAQRRTPLKLFTDNDDVTRYLTVEADVAGAVTTWDSSTVPSKHLADGSGVASYTALPTTGVSGGDFDKIITGTAVGIYQYAAFVGGDAFGIWLPSDLAARITDYVRDGSSNPCKISMSNGVGSDTKTIITGRGWAESNTGDASINDTLGDLEFLGGTSDTNSANMTFTPVTGSLTARQVLLVADVDVVTLSGGQRSGRVLIEGNTASHFPVIITLALDAIANDVGFLNNAEAAQVGQGSFNTGSFGRMFGELATGWTSGTNSPPHHLWRASTGQVVGDISALVTDNTTTTGETIQLTARNTGGAAPKFQVREFHVFQLEG